MSTPDPATLAFYAEGAARYAEFTAAEAGRGWLAAFMARLPAGAHVLDWGAGPGWAAGALQAAGFTVEATDACAAFAAEAASRHGVTLRIETFEALEAESRFDGGWASFSLLHAPRAALPSHLARLHRALKPGAPVYLGMKAGEGEGRDGLGRLYTFVTEAELTALATVAGFHGIGIEAEVAQGLEGRPQRYLHLSARA